MSRDATWYRRNDEYLAAALALLRHRLNAAMSSPAPAGAPTKPSVDQARRRGWDPASWFGGLAGARTPDKQPPILLPAPEPAISSTEERRLADAVAEAAKGEPNPALISLGQIFGLSNFEREVVLLCVAVELDSGISARMESNGHPSFGLAMSLLREASWDALAPDAPLRHWNLVRIDRGNGKTLTSSPLIVDERILNYVKGLDHIDARLAPMLRPVILPQQEGPASRREVVAAVTEAFDPVTPAVAMVRGPDRACNEDVAARAAAAQGLSLLRLAADALPADIADIDELARLWHREALLARIALLVEAYDIDGGHGPETISSRVSRFVGRSGGAMVIATRDGLDLPLTPAVNRRVGRPTTGEQLNDWLEVLSSEPGAAEAARRMASRFDLDRAAISATARAARNGGSARPIAERLQEAAIARTRTDLARLAERIQVKAAFGDIVLPPRQEAQLRQIVDHLEHRMTVIDDWGFGFKMNRGVGVSALFAGDTGTGKTMAAEVVAGALGMDLFRIDLSAVVSKYIGETEKNLSRLFDAADLGGVVLLFDEADALFGKRSEVKDAHDRFANIEIDYLLQRMESYRGVAILTTNMKSALDPAFKRRLRFIVDFPYPGPADRRRIWQRALPHAVPRGDIDLDHLARIDLTGASIQSVALNAAFLAAARRTEVTTAILLEAARTEFQKFGRPFNETDFRLPDKSERNAA